MKQTPYYIIACLLLTGCYSPEQVEAARKAQEQADINTCASYGLHLGSEAFGNCRLQLDLARQQRYYYNDPYPYPVTFGAGYYRYR